MAEDVIKGLQVLIRLNGNFLCYGEHDVIYGHLEPKPDDMSEEDRQAMDEAGWNYGNSGGEDGWYKFV